MEIRKNDRIVFLGDSITEWGRDKADPASLGTGFVSLVAADLLEHHRELNLQLFNRGIGGNKVQDLLDRVDADCLLPTKTGKCRASADKERTESCSV